MFGRASVRTDRRPCISIWSLRAPESHWGSSAGWERSKGRGGGLQPVTTAGRGWATCWTACFARPVVTARRLAESLGVTPQAATAALRVLRPAGLVREVTGRELPGLQPEGLRLEMGEGRGARRFHSRLSARCGLSVRLRLRDCGPGLAQDDAPFADSDEGFRVSGHG